MSSQKYNTIAMPFCPHCGRETLQCIDQRKWQCESCGFVLYHNVAAAVAVIIEREGQILFTRRAKYPGKGLLDLPGGFTDPKETAEETCSREIREELDVHLSPESLFYLASHPNDYFYKGILYQTMDLFYKADLPTDAHIKLEVSEIQEIVWIDKDHIPFEELAFDSQKTVLKKTFPNQC